MNLGKLFRRLYSCLSHTNAQTSRRPSSRPCTVLDIESLEAREMLSASPLYQLASDGSLYQASTMRLIDGNVKSYAVEADGHVDYLRNDGYLWSYKYNLGNGTDWRMIDGNVTSYVLANDGRLDYLRGDGQLWSYKYYLGNWGDMKLVDRNVKSYAIEADGHIDYLRGDGYLWSYKYRLGNGTDWRMIDGNVTSYVLANDGRLDYLRGDGKLWSYKYYLGNWGDMKLIDGNVKSYIVEADGRINYLRNDGMLWSYQYSFGNGYDWKQIEKQSDGAGAVVALFPSGALYRVVNDQTAGSSWRVIEAGDVASFAVESGGNSVVVLTRYGSLYRVLGDLTIGRSERVIEAGDIASFALEPGGNSVVVLTKYGSLYRVLGDLTIGRSERVIEAGDIVSFALEPGGNSVVVLTRYGSLYRVLGDLTIGRSERVIEADGVVKFALGRFDSSLERVFSLNINGSLSMDGTRTWTGVLDFAVGDDGSLYQLDASGTLLHRVNGAWQTVATNVRSFDISADGATIDVLKRDGDLYRNGVPVGHTRLMIVNVPYTDYFVSATVFDKYEANYNSGPIDGIRFVAPAQGVINIISGHEVAQPPTLFYNEDEFEFLRRHHAYSSISTATNAVQAALDTALTWVKNNAPSAMLGVGLGILTRNPYVSIGGVVGASIVRSYGWSAAFDLVVKGGVAFGLIPEDDASDARSALSAVRYLAEIGSKGVVQTFARLVSTGVVADGIAQFVVDALPDFPLEAYQATVRHVPAPTPIPAPTPTPTPPPPTVQSWVLVSFSGTILYNDGWGVRSLYLEFTDRYVRLVDYWDIRDQLNPEDDVIGWNKTEMTRDEALVTARSTAWATLWSYRPYVNGQRVGIVDMNSIRVSIV